MGSILLNHFQNPKNGREYSIEVINGDLLGDITVTRYFGSQRLISVHDDLNDALVEVGQVRMVREKRGYYLV